MPVMIANHQIVLHPEGGKRRVVKAGTAYNFTDDQIAELTAIDPNAIRAPVNETVSGELARPAATQAAEPRANEPRPVGRRGRGGNALTGAGSKPLADDDGEL